MFDHTHYVPILRWKMGEKGALRALDPEIRAKLTPLIEWSRPNEVPAQDEDVSAGAKPDCIATDILANWGARPFFCDVHNLLDGQLRGSVNRLRPVVVNLRDGGTRAIPVFLLDDSPAYVTALRCLAVTAGACVRLRRDDVFEPSLQSRLDRLLSTAEVTADRADLVIDMGSAFAGMDIAAFCAAVSTVLSWRSFTVAAGSFPKDLMAFREPGRYYQPRAEWQGWRLQIGGELPRLPTFGDYATIHPILTKYKPGINPSASVLSLK